MLAETNPGRRTDAVDQDRATRVLVLQRRQRHDKLVAPQPLGQAEVLAAPMCPEALTDFRPLAASQPMLCRLSSS